MKPWKIRAFSNTYIHRCMSAYVTQCLLLVNDTIFQVNDMTWTACTCVHELIYVCIHVYIFSTLYTHLRIHTNAHIYTCGMYIAPFRNMHTWNIVSLRRIIISGKLTFSTTDLRGFVAHTNDTISVCIVFIHFSLTATCLLRRLAYEDACK